MRTLARTIALQGGARRTACRLPLAGCTPRSASAAARARCASAAACSSDGSGSKGSSAASSAKGWLLEPAFSDRHNRTAYASSGSFGSSSSSSPHGSGNSSGSASSSCSYDAVMMLGGGLLPNGGLPEWVVRRLEGSLHLYTQQVEAARLQAFSFGPGSNGNGGSEASSGSSSGSSSGGSSVPGAPPIVLLGAGTPHKPPVIDDNGYVLHESTAYAEYLLRRGVPAGDLLKEAQSYDTVGNGYFSLLMHTLPAGWRRIAVVTSDFHMLRTAATFDFIYGLAGRQLYGDAAWFDLHYRPVSDEGIFPSDVLAARAEKEAAAVAAWQRNTAGMASLADLHRWLYATHLCYSVGRQHEFGKRQELDAKLAATY